MVLNLEPFCEKYFPFSFPLNINEYSLQIARIFLVVRSRAPLYGLNVTSMHARMQPQSPLSIVAESHLMLQKLSQPLSTVSLHNLKRENFWWRCVPFSRWLWEYSFAYT